MKITYSAPTPVVISGEYSAQYSHPLLYVTADLPLKFTVETAQGDFSNDEKVVEIGQRVREYLAGLDQLKSDEKYKSKIDSQIPKGPDLGYDTALVVAATGAFLEFHSGKQHTQVEVAQIVQKLDLVENLPSHSRLLIPVMAGWNYARKEFDFLTFSTQIDLPQNLEKDQKFYIVYSGDRTESTQQLQSMMQEYLEENPALVKKALRDIERCTKTIVYALKTSNSDLLAKIIEKNHKLLAKIGVVSDSTRELLEKLKDFGVGKISGFGGQEKGSGYVFFYCREGKNKALEQYLQSKKMIWFPLVIDSQGLKKVD